MPRNETVEMDLTVTLNTIVSVVYNAKGLVEDVFVAETTTLDTAFLDNQRAHDFDGTTVEIKSTQVLQANIKEMLNDEIVSSRT